MARRLISDFLKYSKDTRSRLLLLCPCLPIRLSSTSTFAAYPMTVRGLQRKAAMQTVSSMAFFFQSMPANRPLQDKEALPIRLQSRIPFPNFVRDSPSRPTHSSHSHLCTSSRHLPYIQSLLLLYSLSISISSSVLQCQGQTNARPNIIAPWITGRMVHVPIREANITVSRTKRNV